MNITISDNRSLQQILNDIQFHVDINPHRINFTQEFRRAFEAIRAIDTQLLSPDTQALAARVTGGQTVLRNLFRLQLRIILRRKVVIDRNCPDNPDVRTLVDMFNRKIEALLNLADAQTAMENNQAYVEFRDTATATAAPSRFFDVFMKQTMSFKSATEKLSEMKHIDQLHHDTLDILKNRRAALQKLSPQFTALFNKRENDDEIKKTQQLYDEHLKKTTEFETKEVANLKTKYETAKKEALKELDEHANKFKTIVDQLDLQVQSVVDKVAKPVFSTITVDSNTMKKTYDQNIIEFKQLSEN